MRNILPIHEIDAPLQYSAKAHYEAQSICANSRAEVLRSRVELRPQIHSRLAAEGVFLSKQWARQ